ncbi:MAG: hypothetical protein Q8K30_05885 [Candidatus Gracilibacteria bacterium]|nr:hypothetical protein [Candidatus Gracilibacteria bacterium]MDP3381682.1 hypothetical protein [bacterium]
MTIFTAKNILDAYKLARKLRKNKQEVYMFDQNLEERLIMMLNELKNKIASKSYFILFFT